jgi:glycine/D-amino acid oxidase-like deaminating enzyme
VKALSDSSSIRKDERFDVVVIGAGVIGLSSAYHMKSENTDLRIIVLDETGAAGQGDTAKSAGAFRNVFTSDVNRLLAGSSIDFYGHIQKDLGFNLDLKYSGYLWLLADKQFRRLENVVESMRREGIQLRIWEKKDLKDMINGVNLEFGENDEEAGIIKAENVVKGLQGIKCGVVSPDLIAKFYEQEFRKIGGTIRYNTKVGSLLLEPRARLGIPSEPLIWQDKKISGVKTAAGTIVADTVVVAAGCRADRLLDPIGIDARFRPRKRQIFSLRSPEIEALLNTKGFNEYDILPFTITPRAGVFIRPEPAERGFWVGAADELGRSFRFEEEPQAERDYYTYSIYPVLSKYFPQFMDVSPTNMWAGLYDVNTLDAIPYLFEEDGAIVVSGLSGSGIMKADAVGRMVTALYEKKEYANLYGGKEIRVARLGINERDVGIERFVL